MLPHILFLQWMRIGYLNAHVTMLSNFNSRYLPGNGIYNENMLKYMKLLKLKVFQ